MRVLKTSLGYMVELQDSICSVATTDKGKELFGGKGVTFYKSGSFVVNIPYEALMEVAAEAFKHVKKFESDD